MVIEVQDVNDNPPVFEETVYTGFVLENADVGYIVHTVTAHDKDVNENGNVKYSFENKTNLFSIDENLGMIKVNSSLEGQAGIYVLGLVAEDHGDPKQEGKAVINITVQDVNLNQPVITDIPANNTVKVYEVCNFVRTSRILYMIRNYDHIYKRKCIL